MMSVVSSESKQVSGCQLSSFVGKMKALRGLQARHQLKLQATSLTKAR